MSADEQCTKRVFSGARWDTGGHQCGRKRWNGTQFCKQHYDLANPQPLEATDQRLGPEREESASLSTSFRWGEGDGPRLARWGKRWAVRHLRITMNVRTATPYLKWEGPQVKKDGTESKGTWTSEYAEVDDFPKEARAVIENQIVVMKSLATDLVGRLA